MGSGFRSRCRLFRFGLHGFEAQDLTVLVALVQSFELVNKGGGTVSFEALISKKKEKMYLSICMYQQFATIIGLKRNTHPFLEVAIPTSVSLIPTPENHKIRLIFSLSVI